MPKLVSPPVRSPISFQFASPRASRFSLSTSRTSVFVIGRIYGRLTLGMPALQQMSMRIVAEGLRHHKGSANDNN